MPLALMLEDFAQAAADPDGDTRPASAAAFDAGYAQATDDMAARQAQLSQDLVQGISDIGFGFAEARLHVMAGLEPLFRALVAKVLPTILPDSFRSHLTAHLVHVAKADMATPFRLKVHPSQLTAVGDCLPDAIARLLVLSGDATLGPHVALITRSESETLLDHDALNRDITAALSALFDDITESRAHG
ncbi:flagellar assembly protein FliH [Loktanella fryxellensis]|uniref:Flagellar assembly protein FliH n=1 Tax=Loktanella fryxellensis TaxID=245187 RepID=A0A1H7ZPM3_9RHOB|nr:hypothetical protein [Loktanella fryxellensis]SEM60233.1 flagellar assembly protein FliH [Loktanella fryxellensis]